MGSWRLWRRTGAWGNGAKNCGGSAVAVPRRGGPVLGQVADVPVMCHDSVWVDSAENCGVPAVASFVMLRCSSSPWTRLVTCPCWQVWGPRQSTEAFGGISYDFYANADRFKLILGSASVHGRFWMNFLGFLRAVRGQGC